MIKRFIFPLTLLLAFCATSQELRLKKGVVIDSVPVLESATETFSLYIPTSFSQKGTWPLLVPLESKGRSSQIMKRFKNQAEKNGYILASPNSIHDSIPLSDNMVRLGNVLSSLESMFPINANRIFTAGFDDGARLANLTPFVFDNIRGVLSCGAALSNVELLTTKNSFYFLALVGKDDFTYAELLETESLLNENKLTNTILVFEGGKEWPKPEYLDKALRYFILKDMAKGFAIKDNDFITTMFSEDVEMVERLLTSKKPLLAYRELKEMQNVFKDLMPLDSIRKMQRAVRKTKDYKKQKNLEQEARFKELLLKEDLLFALEEDVATLNYNNLGWWNYQMKSLDKLINSKSTYERNIGNRLKGLINAVAADNLDIARQERW